METSLILLNEQIKAIKCNYYNLLGECENLLNNSNNLLKIKKEIQDIESAKKINNEIKILSNYILELKEQIDDL